MIMAAPTPSRNTGIGIAAPIYALLTWLVMADAQRDDEGGIEEVGQDALDPRTPHLEEEAAAVAGRINGLALPIRSLPDEASGTCLNQPHRPGALHLPPPPPKPQTPTHPPVTPSDGNTPLTPRQRHTASAQKPASLALRTNANAKPFPRITEGGPGACTCCSWGLPPIRRTA
jgi:hypothetical protein